MTKPWDTISADNSPATETCMYAHVYAYGKQKQNRNLYGNRDIDLCCNKAVVSQIPHPVWRGVHYVVPANDKRMLKFWLFLPRTLCVC